MEFIKEIKAIKPIFDTDKLKCGDNIEITYSNGELYLKGIIDFVSQKYLYVRASYGLGVMCQRVDAEDIYNEKYIMVKVEDSKYE